MTLPNLIILRQNNLKEFQIFDAVAGGTVSTPILSEKNYY